jgi:hypothetical protein
MQKCHCGTMVGEGREDVARSFSCSWKTPGLSIVQNDLRKARPTKLLSWKSRSGRSDYDAHSVNFQEFSSQGLNRSRPARAPHAGVVKRRRAWEHSICSTTNLSAIEVSEVWRLDLSGYDCLLPHRSDNSIVWHQKVVKTFFCSYDRDWVCSAVAQRHVEFWTLLLSLQAGDTLYAHQGVLVTFVSEC